MPRAIAIAVRPWTTNAGGQKVPTVPAQWTAVYEDNGWCTVRHADGRWFHAWLACENGANAAFVVEGPRAIVDFIVGSSSRAWATLNDLRADGGAVALAVKAAWLARWEDLGEPGVIRVRARIAGYLDDDGETSP